MNKTTPAVQKYSKLIEKVSLFIFCCVLYFVYQRNNLLTISLTFDELYTWGVTTLSWNELLSALDQDTQHPIYFILIKIWRSLPFPDNDYFLRLPSVFFAALALFSGAQYFINKYPSDLLPFLTYVILFLFMPLLNYSGISTRPYVLLLWGAIWLTSLSNVFFTNSPAENRHFNIQLIAATALVIWSHPLGLIFLFSIVSSLFVFKGTIWLKKFSDSDLLILMAVIFTNLISFYAKFTNLALISWANDSEKYNLKSVIESLLSPLSWFVILGLIAYNKKNITPKLRFLFLTLGIYFSVMILLSIGLTSLLVPRYWIAAAVLLLFIIPELVAANKGKISIIFGVIFLIAQSAANPIPWPEGYKEALTAYKRQHIVKEDETWVCITNEAAGFYIPVIYFSMYWARDLCGNKLTMADYLEQENLLPNKKLFVDKQMIAAESMAQLKEILSDKKKIFTSPAFDIYEF